MAANALTVPPKEDSRTPMSNGIPVDRLNQAYDLFQACKGVERKARKLYVEQGSPGGSKPGLEELDAMRNNSDEWWVTAGYILARWRTGYGRDLYWMIEGESATGGAEGNPRRTEEFSKHMQTLYNKITRLVQQTQTNREANLEATRRTEEEARM